MFALVSMLAIIAGLGQFLIGRPVWTVVSNAGLLAWLASTLFLRSALRKLSRIDPGEFSNPSKLVLLILPAVVILVGTSIAIAENPGFQAFSDYFAPGSQRVGPIPQLPESYLIEAGLSGLGYLIERWG